VDDPEIIDLIRLRRFGKKSRPGWKLISDRRSFFTH
jgi:hypothetical protein